MKVDHDTTEQYCRDETESCENAFSSALALLPGSTQEHNGS